MGQKEKDEVFEERGEKKIVREGDKNFFFLLLQVVVYCKAACLLLESRIQHPAVRIGKKRWKEQCLLGKLQRKLWVALHNDTGLHSLQCSVVWEGGRRRWRRLLIFLVVFGLTYRGAALQHMSTRRLDTWSNLDIGLFIRCTREREVRERIEAGEERLERVTTDLLSEKYVTLKVS